MGIDQVKRYRQFNSILLSTFVSIWPGLKHNYLLSLCFKVIVAYVFYYVTAVVLNGLPVESSGIPGVFVNTRFVPDPPYGLRWLENETNFWTGLHGRYENGRTSKEE